MNVTQTPYLDPRMALSCVRADTLHSVTLARWVWRVRGAVQEQQG